MRRHNENKSNKATRFCQFTLAFLQTAVTFGPSNFVNRHLLRGSLSLVSCCCSWWCKVTKRNSCVVTWRCSKISNSTKTNNIRPTKFVGAGYLNKFTTSE